VDFMIDRGIISSYPDVKIGVLVCRNVKVERVNPGLEDFKEKAIAEAVDRMGSEPVTRHPFISSWREMYRSFGTKPGDYRPSAEALLRRTLKRKALPRINTAVDAYNATSIRYMIPMGGFDVDKTQGRIALRYSVGGERFLPLGASEPEETYEGEPVYVDDFRILTRRWNYRDCDETKISTESRNLAMFIDGSGEIPREVVGKALSELGKLLREYCGGDCSKDIANEDNPTISI